MKRLIVCGVVVAGLLLPTVAFSKPRFYAAPMPGSNAGLEFGITFKNHKPRKVARFEYHNISGVGTCSFLPEGGPAQPGWRINRKAKFHGTLRTGNYVATVTGHLRKPANHYRKIRGTFRVQGNGCDTGTLNYVATK